MLPQASNLSGTVDFVFWFITGVSLFFLILVTALMVYFAIRYNRKHYKTPKDIHGHLGLEILWTVVPTILVLMMFWYGWNGFKEMRAVPNDAIIVQANGQMWQWRFAYSNGKNSAELYVPLGKPVKVELNSLDVIHSFFIPAFRVKEDVVPGKKNYLWFTGTQEGTYDIECAEYCGQRHAYMLSKVHVIPETEFNTWLNQVEIAADQSPGEKIIKDKGCLGCHSVDGSKLVGPSFKGLYGKQEIVVTGGNKRTVVVDDAHIKRAIEEPAAEHAEGYQPIMPKIELSDQEIVDIINHLKTLR